ncbi:MAG TPA: lactonase family protein [Bryobacteraceae bacterium]|nr:lactonase family protein [Bryobacteraceae bacterium]
MVRVFSIILMVAASLSAEHVYIGTSGKGIYLADFDTKSGKLSAPAMVSDTAAPSYLTIHEGHLYAVNEVNDGAVSSFTIDRSSGKLTPLNSMSVKSAGPCYIAIDKSGHSAITANYSGGSITVLPIGGDGRLSEATDFIQHKGSGPNRDSQTMPHPHWVGFIPASKLALIADLGIDEVGIYNFDAKKGKLTVGNPAFATLPPGSGPRHVTLHNAGKYMFMYVLTELSSNVTLFIYEPELKRFTAVQTLSTRPEGAKGDNTGAEIEAHPTGKFVYASNRGDDSIAVFSVNDMKRGTLKLDQNIPSGGKTPRQFEIDPSGHWLLAGNQNSDNIAIFSIDASTGKLTAAGVVTGVPKPACIKFVK